MLFSATQTRKVEDLARISLKKEPLDVGVDDNKDNATVDGPEQVLEEEGTQSRRRRGNKRQKRELIKTYESWESH